MVSIAISLSASAGERLSGAKLAAEYKGVRLYATAPSGGVVQHDYDADGTITAEVGGYEAYMARTGQPCQYAEADPYE